MHEVAQRPSERWSHNQPGKKIKDVRKSTIPTESITLQDPAARLINTLPDKWRQETDYEKFVRLAKNLTLSNERSTCRKSIGIVNFGASRDIKL